MALAAPLAFAQTLIVSAAASLGPPMREIVAAFAAAHPAVEVRLNLGASQTLLAQIAQGAPADVLATADEATLDRAQAQHLIVDATRRTFARNRLVLVVPANAPSPPTDMAALAATSLRRVAIGNPQTVPAGRYAQAALEQAGVWPAVRARLVHAGDVRQVLGYVERGEVDAGFVYRTDALGAGGKVRTVFTVPGTGPVLYPIAVVAARPQASLATDFVSHVAGPAGQAILARHGFERP